MIITTDKGFLSPIHQYGFCGSQQKLHWVTICTHSQQVYTQNIAILTSSLIVCWRVLASLAILRAYSVPGISHTEATIINHLCPQHTLNSHHQQSMLFVNSTLIDLDLDSTHTQVDASGHTLTPFWSVLSCFFLLNKSLLTVLLQFVHRQFTLTQHQLHRLTNNVTAHFIS